MAADPLAPESLAPESLVAEERVVFALVVVASLALAAVSPLAPAAAFVPLSAFAEDSSAAASPAVASAGFALASASLSLAGRAVRALAVALVVPLAALVLVGEHPQLLAAVVADHGGGDLRAGQFARPRAHLALVVDHQQRDELDVAAVVASDVLHVDDVTDLDLVLLSAGADDGVHVSTVLSEPLGSGGTTQKACAHADRQG